MPIQIQVRNVIIPFGFCFPKLKARLIQNAHHFRIKLFRGGDLDFLRYERQSNMPKTNQLADVLQMVEVANLIRIEQHFEGRTRDAEKSSVHAVCSPAQSAVNNG